ncbi:uncharacterized protein LOC116614682 [Nematostella vectensis]|uniref:uncharacterized protein LOC116614682 n=1 Tax=Nematostella vectensis TaxID=45351 RepID=UPI002076EBD9|nr:uncharacterized protein LOC116614682 [Nematostella vectensis]
MKNCQMFPPPLTPDLNRNTKPNLLISFDRLQQNIDGILQRDVIDCKVRNLVGLLSSNSRLYVDKAGNNFKGKQRNLATDLRVRYSESFNHGDSWFKRECDMKGKGTNKHLSRLCLDAQISETSKIKSGEITPFQESGKDSDDSNESICLDKDLSEKRHTSTKGKFANMEKRLTKKARRNTTNAKQRRISCDYAHGIKPLPSNGWWANKDDDSESDSETNTETTANREISNEDLKIIANKTDYPTKPEHYPTETKYYPTEIKHYSTETDNYPSKSEQYTTETEHYRSASEPTRFIADSDANLGTSFFYLTNSDCNTQSNQAKTTKNEIKGKSNNNHSAVSLGRIEIEDSENSMIAEPAEVGFGGLITRPQIPKTLSLDCGILLEYKDSVGSRFGSLEDTRIVPDFTSLAEQYKGKHAPVSEANQTKYGRTIRDGVAKRTENARNGRNMNRKLEQPTKFRLKHTHSRCSRVKYEEAAGQGDGRLLPTTLTKSSKSAFSLMSPYMATVVWSVMQDENIDELA